MPPPSDALRAQLDRWFQNVDVTTRLAGNYLVSAYDLRLAWVDVPPGVAATLAPGCRAWLGVARKSNALTGTGTCIPGKSGQKCAHQVALASRVKEGLERGEDHDALRRLRRLVAPPTPADLLADLDELVAPFRPAPRATRSSGETCWVVSFGPTVAVALHMRTPMKSGEFSRPRQPPRHERLELIEASRHPQDQAVLELLHRSVNGVGSLSQGTFDFAFQRMEAVALLAALAGHPQVFMRADEEPIRLVTVAPAVEVVLVDGEVVVGLDKQTLVPGEQMIPLNGGIVQRCAALGELRVMPVEDKATLNLVMRLASERLRLPASIAGDVAERLESLGTRLPVRFAPELEGSETPGDRRLHIRIEPDEAGAMMVSLRLRPLTERDACVPGEGPVRVTGSRDGQRVYVLRAFEEEQGLAVRLSQALGLKVAAPDWSALLEGDEVLDLAAHLAELPGQGEQWVVEWAKGAAPRVVRKPGQLKVQVTRAADWFGLDGEVEFDGTTVALATLLGARRQGRRFLEIAPGKFVQLALASTRQLDRLEDVTHENRGQLALSRAASAVADQLFEDVEVRAPPDWQQVVERMRTAAEVDPALPPGFTAELRPYQQDGYLWLKRLAHLGLGGVLADDMGLGKTVQTIAMLVTRAPQGPQLVVCPTSVAGNWRREFERFAPSLRPLDFRTLQRDTLAERAAPGDVVIVTYGLLRAGLATLRGRRWTTLVIDEAQTVKNWGTESAKAVRALEVDWKIALSGTPMENHLGELYSLVESVCPGVFGTWEHFSRTYAGPIERHGDKARRDRLSRLVRPIILRRTKAQVLTELPPRTEVRLDVTLSKTERLLYEAARAQAAANLSGLVAEDEDGSRLHVLAALTELRQLASCARTVRPGAPLPSAKMSLLTEKLVELIEEDGSALVFSQFVRQIDLLSAHLTANGIKHLVLTGATPAAERERLVEAFQRREAQVFLVSLKAGGTGLNLTAADNVFLLDPWWNPAVEDQAADRAHRIGQTRPVTIYRLVAKDTVEERVLALHARKRDLVAGVLAGTDLATRLGTKDLLALIGEGASDAEVAEEAAPAPAEAPKGKNAGTKPPALDGPALVKWFQAHAPARLGESSMKLYGSSLRGALGPLPPGAPLEERLERQLHELAITSPRALTPTRRAALIALFDALAKEELIDGAGHERLVGQVRPRG